MENGSPHGSVDTSAMSPSPRDMRTAANELSQMIERAQYERFKLAHAMKQAGEAHPAGTDSQRHEATPSDAASGEVQIKIRSVDQWIARRMEEFHKADGMLEERLARMERLEASVSKLSEALRQQMASALPTTEKLDALKKQLQYDLEGRVGEAALSVKRLLDPIDSRIAHLEGAEQRLAERLDEYEQRVTSCAEQSVLAIESRSRELEAGIEQMLGEARGDFAGLVEQSQARVREAGQGALSRLEAAAEPLQRETNEVIQQAEKEVSHRLNEIELRARSQARNLVQRMKEQFRNLVREHTQSFEAQTQARHDEVIASAQAVSDSLAQKLVDLVQQGNDQSQQVVEQINASIEQGKRQMAEEAEKQQAVVAEAISAQRRELQHELAGARGRIEDCFAEAERAASQRVEAVVAHAGQRGEGLAKALRRQFAQAYRKAAGAMAPLQHRLDEIEQQIRDASGPLDRHLDGYRAEIRNLRLAAEEQTRAVEAEFEEVLSGISEKGASQLGAFEQRFEEASRPLSRRIEAYEADLETLASKASTRLDQNLEQSRRRLDEMVRTMQLRIQGACDDVDTAMMALEERVEKGIERTQAKLDRADGPLSEHIKDFDGHVDEILGRIDERLGEIKRARMSMIDLAEQQFVRRIDALKPRMDAELRDTERLVNQRMERIEQHLQSIMKMAESETDERLERALPRVQEVCEKAAEKVACFLSDMELRVDELARPVEEKLAERIDLLMEQSQSAMIEAMTRLDEVGRKLGQLGDIGKLESLDSAQIAARLGEMVREADSQAARLTLLVNQAGKLTSPDKAARTDEVAEHSKPAGGSEIPSPRRPRSLANLDEDIDIVNDSGIVARLDEVRCRSKKDAGPGDSVGPDSIPAA